MKDRSVLFALTSWPARAARGRFPIVCLLACFLILLFPSYWAEGATLKKVFAVGDPVEGLAGITVQLVTHAKLTGDGRVVAVVWLQGPGVVAANREAIVSAVPGGPVQIWGRAGDPALGDGVPGGTTIASFGSLNSSVPLEASDTGVVARRVTINVPGTAFQPSAVVAGGMGTLRVEVFDEKPWPVFGQGVKLRTGGDPGVSRTGEIAFSTLSSSGGPYAVWKGQPGAVTVVAREGLKYDGLPGKGIFDTFRPPVVINETGELCFHGQLEKDFVAPLVVTDANRDRLWKAGPPFVGMAIAGSEIAGGGTLEPNQAWAFRGPWALFTGFHRVPARSDTVVAVTKAGATPQIILHPQRNAPDAGGGSLGPFAFVSQLDTTVVPSGVVVTNQRLLIGGAVNSTNVKGIWRWDGAALRLLARQGEEVPGLPGRHWSDLRIGLALPSGKGVFSAFVPEKGSPTNPTKGNWTGLWWGESAASLELLLEDGGPIDLGGSVGTVHSFNIIRSANDTHLLVDLQYLTAGGGASVSGLALVDPAAAAPNGALGGTIRLDYDEDGDLAEGGDLPVSGILCELLARDAAGNPTGPVLKTSTSADNGTYVFADVPPGAYIVRAALDAGQRSLGVRWTSPRPITEGAATVSRSADVTGVPTGKLDFLMTTAIRPDSFADGNDGDVGPGRQSLREALDRAQRRSKLFFTDAVIELLPGRYLLDAPLLFNSSGGFARLVTLRAPAARPLGTILDGQGKTGIMENRPGGKVKVEWVQFQSGRNEGDGGALTSGGAVRQEGLSFEASHCGFVSCFAVEGGAVANLAGMATFRSCAFAGNSALGGGAFSCQGASSSVTIEDSLIVGNTSSQSGGGGIDVSAGSLRLERTSVIRNIVEGFGGAGLSVATNAPIPFLHSCLLQSGEGRISSLGYNLIASRAGLTVIAQTGDLFDLDPRLAADGNLLADSPAIDAGDPRFVPATMPEDILGKPRVVGARIDIGAIEFQGTPNRLVGGKVRLDYDQDGDLSDTEDLPVPGLDFELLARDAVGNPTGPVLKTSTSGGDGTYGFDGVNPGAYIVRATLDADQQTLGLSWTSPAKAPATVSRRLDLPGPDAAKLDFLATTALRPDDRDPGDVYPDGNDGDVWIGMQSLREALDRASKIPGSGAVDLSPGRYLLDSPLLIGESNETKFMRLRGKASRPIRTFLDGQGKTRLMEIKPGGDLTVEWVEFQNGKATAEMGRGGAVKNEGKFEAVRCAFTSSSSATDGGALANAAGAVSLLFSCAFTGNVASHNGGAIWCDFAGGLSVQLTDSVLSSNRAEARGGAIATEGGGINLYQTSVVGNHARLEGGGLMVFDGSSLAENSLFAKNTSDAVPPIDPAEDGSGPLFSQGYNLFEAPGRLAFVPGSASTDQRGKPAGLVDGDIRLKPDSPAINGGDPALVPNANSTDIFGNPRIVGGRIDIGAVEFQGTPEDWALTFFGEAVANNPGQAATVHGLAADPDKDGVPNLLERALGGNPTSPSQTRDDGTPLLPEVARTGAAAGGAREPRDGEERLAFRFTLDERYTDLRYTVQISEDGAAWADEASFLPLGAGLGFRRDPAPGGLTAPGVTSVLRFLHHVSETLSFLPGDRRLVRLRVN